MLPEILYRRIGGKGRAKIVATDISGGILTQIRTSDDRQKKADDPRQPRRRQTRPNGETAQPDPNRRGGQKPGAAENSIAESVFKGQRNRPIGFRRSRQKPQTFPLLLMGCNIELQGGNNQDKHNRTKRKNRSFGNRLAQRLNVAPAFRILQKPRNAKSRQYGNRKLRQMEKLDRRTNHVKQRQTVQKTVNRRVAPHGKQYAQNRRTSPKKNQAIRIRFRRRNRISLLADRRNESRYERIQRQGERNRSQIQRMLTEIAESAFRFLPAFTAPQAPPIRTVRIPAVQSAQPGCHKLQTSLRRQTPIGRKNPFRSLLFRFRVLLIFSFRLPVGRNNRLSFRNLLHAPRQNIRQEMLDRPPGKEPETDSAGKSPEQPAHPPLPQIRLLSVPDQNEKTDQRVRRRKP